MSTGNITNGDRGTGDYNPDTGVNIVIFATRDGGGISYFYEGHAAIAIYNGGDPANYTYTKKIGGVAHHPRVKKVREKSGVAQKFGEYMVKLAQDSVADVAEGVAEIGGAIAPIL